MIRFLVSEYVFDQDCDTVKENPYVHRKLFVLKNLQFDSMYKLT